MVVLQEVYDYLRSICADVHVTKGDFDEQKGYPEDEVLSIGDFRIGLCHGHQVGATMLLSLLEQQAVNVLRFCSDLFGGTKITGCGCAEQGTSC